MIRLDLTDDEAAALAIALVMLIHETAIHGSRQAHWRTAASDVAARLETLRNTEGAR